MSLKTKLFSLFIIALLVLPIFVSPQRSGQVLGTSETNSSGAVNASAQKTNNEEAQENNTSILSNFIGGGSTANEGPAAKQSKVGEIASGIRDVRTVDGEQTQDRVYTGKAVMDENTLSPVASDKFNLGAGIKINYNGQTISKVVGSSRLLSPDTLLVVDKATFIEMGGKPDQEREIQVSITLDR